MKRAHVLLALVLVLLLGSAATWIALDEGADGGPDGGAPGEAAGTVRGTGAPGRGTRPRAGSGSEPPPKPRARARRPGEFESSGDPLLDRARAEAAAGRALEALEIVLPARRKGDAAWKEKDRVAEMVGWEDAALDRFAASIGIVERKELFAWLRRLDAAVLDPARRRRLDLIRRTLVEGGKLDLQSILDAASATERREIEEHLKRFGAPGSMPPIDEKSRRRLDDQIDALRARNAQRTDVVPPLPADSEADRELRRLEQLEKLRQRDATGLLAPIASGLAWLALHQADDGEVSDTVTSARCTWFGHTLCTADGAAGKGQYAVAATSLSVLAWLDFRDQDTAALFEPSIARGVTWLRKRIGKDGALPVSGYEGAIAAMALGQAAKASGAKDLGGDVERVLRFVASKASADGGFRYGWGAPTADLSVTGWFVQAFEQARDAGLKVPPTLAPGLEKFVRSVWPGGAAFKYEVSRPRESSTLAGVGMLSLQILAPKEAEKQTEAWTKALAATAGKRGNDLYATYYDVRTELALTGFLSPARHSSLVDLPRSLQRTDPNGAGMFARKPVEQPAPPKGKPQWKPTWTALGWIDTGGRCVSTAFAVLTMEHDLYRR